MSNTPASTKEAGAGLNLADRLRQVRVSARQDLEVTRHVFRGRPAYVVRDPLTFQNHQFTPGDYEVFVAINAKRTLGEIFEELLSQGRSSAEDEEAFYQFVISLHRLNFLNLPISDEKLLYQRHQARQRARRKEKLLGFLFLRVPLINPDAFLEKTLRFARPVFSRWFFAGWLILVAVAGLVAARNFADLISPLQGVLAARNLPIMWFTLVGLKIIHEFGHAYACKFYGGRVPEMGAFFIVFTPCAYVDATACWGFTKRKQRLAVCLAGMYVESVAAALAVFVWAFSGPGLLHDVAYNVLFLAGVVTVLFNINPLMRYDGYYVLSDLLEIPNLRARATRQVVDILKRVFVGVPLPASRLSRWERFLLIGFGVCASLYRIALVLAISAIVASKLFLVGLGVAGFFVGNTVVGLVRRVTKYLWYARETAPVRARAIVVSILMLAVVPAMIVLVPVQSSVQAAGVLSADHETVVRAPADGFVQTVKATPGQTVEPGDVLVELGNDTLDEAIVAAAAELEASDIRRRAYEVDQPTLAREEKEQGDALRLRLARAQQRQSRLIVQVDVPGKIVECVRDRDAGRFVRKGEALATVVSGRRLILTVLTEEQMADASPEPGDLVEVRFEADPSQVLPAVVERVASAGSRTVPTESLTHVGGGGIAVNPADQQARQPYFEVTVALTAPSDSILCPGMTGQVRFRAGPRSIGTAVARRLIRFTNSLQQR